MNNSQLVADTLIRLATMPGLAIRLGAILAAGIVAGYLLYRGTRDLWRWGVLVGLFILFEEWTRSTLIAASPAAMASGAHNGAVSITIAFATLGVFGAAVGTGAFIRAKCKKEISYEKQLKIVEDVAENTSTTIKTEVKSWN